MAKEQNEVTAVELLDEELDLAQGGVTLTSLQAVKLPTIDVATNVQRFLRNQGDLAAHLVMMLHPTDLAAVNLGGLLVR